MVMLYNSVQPGAAPAGAAAVATATGGTIATSLSGVPIAVTRQSPAAAVTGVILAAGLYNGQTITVIDEAVAANTITFAAAPGGGVADGAQAIAGLTARTFVWDSGTSLWYRAA